MFRAGLHFSAQALSRLKTFRPMAVDLLLEQREEGAYQAYEGSDYRRSNPRLNGEKMKSIAIIYATREGHTRKIAEHVTATLAARGFHAVVKNVRDHLATIDISAYSAVFLAASVHMGSHEREMVRFVKEHRAELACVPAAFLSVTLSEAGVERSGQSQDRRERCKAGVKAVIDKFIKETGWHPKYVMAIAGALPYTKYNPLVRFVMKQIAKSEGGDTDTSRDYEYTDWIALDRSVEDVAQDILSSTAGTAALASEA